MLPHLVTNFDTACNGMACDLLSMLLSFDYKRLLVSKNGSLHETFLQLVFKNLHILIALAKRFVAIDLGGHR